MLLNNEKSNKTLELSFARDECAVKGMINCLLSVYGKGYNYVAPKMLDEEFVTYEIRNGNISVFAGTTENGAVAVTASVKRNLFFMKSLEICALAVNDGYRGFRLGSAIIKHILNDYGDSSLFYAHAVMFYSLVGRAFEDNGFVPTGFLFGVCDARKHLSQLNYVSQKHSWAVYVKNNGKSVAGTVYVPEPLTGLIKKIYASLGVSLNIENSEGYIGASSLIEYEQDDYHKTLYFYVMKCGDDLLGKIKAIENEYADALQTVSLFLNINDSSAIRGFDMLKESGYIFSGIKPLCGDREFIIMSKLKDVIMDFTELNMTPSLMGLFNEAGGIR